MINPLKINVLVTGGCGFIGSNLVSRMLERQAFAKIVNLDALTYAGNLDNLANVSQQDGYRFVQGNIGDEALVRKLLAEEDIHAVINLAAESHVDRSIDSPREFIDTNIYGTFNLLHCSLAHFRALDKVRQNQFRFLHVSTDEVYGSLGMKDPAFTERSQYAPNSPYSASKAASDHLVRAHAHTYGLPVLTTNCSNNYGPWQFPEKLIPLTILNALDEKPLPVYGKGENVRDWLFVEDHVDALLLVFEQGIPGETYIIGGECERTNIDIVKTICQKLDEHLPRTNGQSYESLITLVRDRPGHDLRYAMNCSKIKIELGWTQKYDFSTGIDRTLQWYLDNRDWCDNIASKNYQRQRLGLSQLRTHTNCY